MERIIISDYKYLSRAAAAYIGAAAAYIGAAAAAYIGAAAAYMEDK